MQLELCSDYHCPNYYAQLTHETSLRTLGGLALLLLTLLAL